MGVWGYDPRNPSSYAIAGSLLLFACAFFFYWIFHPTNVFLRILSLIGIVIALASSVRCFLKAEKLARQNKGTQWKWVTGLGVILALLMMAVVVWEPQNFFSVGASIFAGLIIAIAVLETNAEKAPSEEKK